MLCFLLEITQVLSPIYLPQVSSVEMENRDLRPKFTILVGNNHTIRSEKLLPFSFALNGAKSDTTLQQFYYLKREIGTLDDGQHGVRSVIVNDNFVAEFTNNSKEMKGRFKQKQDQHKKYINQRRRSAPR
ncbi:reverse transcriptase [Caerostris darwini]|uniref:Reverse transcriptase n=1 Tax=Caerostris darwini TaxID=1538125 RepID=A0AAV4SF75_9ARAC|nr:reverse transcriptase [Caerostris darwini]